VIEGSDLPIAGGRTPNTDGIGLETAGVERADPGFIKVDERLRTTAPGVWAVGDCAGSPHFTHIADHDVRVVSDSLAGIDRTTTGRLVPFCLFTDPELARVGLSESEARDRLPARENPRDSHPPLPDPLRDSWIIQGPGRRLRRPHPRFHPRSPRSRRGHGNRAGRNRRGASLNGAARRDPDPPNDGGRARRAVPSSTRPILTTTDTGLAVRQQLAEGNPKNNVHARKLLEG
jgi:hypothetical protein